MERPVKERMIGAGILVLAGVIVIPWLLDGDTARTTTTEQELILPGTNTQKNETRTVSLEVPSQTRIESSPSIELQRREVKEIPSSVPAEPQLAPVTAQQTVQKSTESRAQLSAQLGEKIDAAAEDVSKEVAQNQPQTRPATTPARPAQFEQELADQASEQLDRAETVIPTRVSPPPKPSTVAKAWAVQVGAFASKENAERLAGRLRSKNYQAFVMRNVVDGRVRFRVRVGPVAERAQADLLAAALKEDRQPAKVLSHP